MRAEPVWTDLEAKFVREAADHQRTLPCLIATKFRAVLCVRLPPGMPFHVRDLGRRPCSRSLAVDPGPTQEVSEGISGGELNKKTKLVSRIDRTFFTTDSGGRKIIYGAFLFINYANTFLCPEVQNVKDGGRAETGSGSQHLTHGPVIAPGL